MARGKRRRLNFIGGEWVKVIVSIKRDIYTYGEVVSLYGDKPTLRYYDFSNLTIRELDAVVSMKEVNWRETPKLHYV